MGPSRRWRMLCRRIAAANIERSRRPRHNARALDSLREMLGLSVALAVIRETSATPQPYRAKWLRDRRAAEKPGLDADIFERIESFEPALAAPEPAPANERLSVEARPGPPSSEPQENRR